MALLDYFRSSKKKTASVAKERLQIIVAHQRKERSKPDYLPQMEKDILEALNNYDLNHNNSMDILKLFSEEIRQFLKSKILQSSIYKLFPYSSQKYDAEEALEEIQESLKNLNTRLSNLKKINKSLNTFEKNSTSLNWDELQKISIEIEESYKDN